MAKLHAARCRLQHTPLFLIVILVIVIVFDRPCRSDSFTWSEPPWNVPSTNRTYYVLSGR